MKRVLVIITLFLGSVAVLKAQSNGATVTMSVTITIVRGNTVANAKSINFNAISNYNKPADISSYDPNAGQFKVAAQPGSSVNINMPDHIQLHDNKGHVLTIDTNTPVYSSTGNQKKAKRFQNDIGGTATVSKSGSIYVWMGGKMKGHLSIPGNYGGTYTTTIEYN